MKFSTRTTYGIRAVAILAKSYGREMVSLPSIAKSENISKSYLERLFSSLKKEKLIISSKGTEGGYRLSRSPQKITVHDIVKALEGEIAPFFCLSKSGKMRCRSQKNCAASKVLIDVQEAIETALKKIKLSDLL